MSGFVTADSLNGIGIERIATPVLLSMTAISSVVIVSVAFLVAHPFSDSNSARAMASHPQRLDKYRNVHVVMASLLAPSSFDRILSRSADRRKR